LHVGLRASTAGLLNHPLGEIDGAEETDMFKKELCDTPRPASDLKACCSDGRNLPDEPSHYPVVDMPRGLRQLGDSVEVASSLLD